MKLTLPEHTLLRLSEFVDEHLALHFPEERWSDLERTITAAATEFGYADVEQFVQRILSSPMTHELLELLTTHLTINETYFWREPVTFEALERSVLPDLIRSRQGEKRIRIWSAGCSTGEEPYSIAMALHRTIPRITDWNITILATDINRQIVHRAAAGVFGQRSFRNAPQWLKDEYASPREKDLFEIIPEIKRMVKFEYLNLADDVFPSPLNDTNAMDIILCRNVLMYFSAKRAGQIVRRLFSSLTQNGYLVVSASELSLPSLSVFTAINVPGMVLYRKTSDALDAEQQIRHEAPVHTPRETMPQANLMKTGEERDLLFQTNEADSPEADSPAQAEIPLQTHALVDDVPVSPALSNLRGVTETLHREQRTPERILYIRACANQGKLDEAVQLCQMAIAEDKLNPGLHYLHATILQENNLLDEAVVSLRRAIYLNPDFVLSYYSLGRIYQRIGNVQRAKKCTDHVLTLLDTYDQNDILFESEGLTAGRFKEMVTAADQSREPA